MNEVEFEDSNQERNIILFDILLPNEYDKYFFGDDEKIKTNDILKTIFKILQNEFLPPKQNILPIKNQKFTQNVYNKKKRK